MDGQRLIFPGKKQESASRVLKANASGGSDLRLANRDEQEGTRAKIREKGDSERRTTETLNRKRDRHRKNAC